MKNAISCVEIPVVDFEKAKAFYSEILGNELQVMPMGDLVFGFLPYDPTSGGVGGAIVKGEPYVPNMNGTTAYLNGGDDLNTILNKVDTAGGRVILPKTQISPEFGYMALFLDTEGNKIGLHSMK